MTLSKPLQLATIGLSVFLVHCSSEAQDPPGTNGGAPNGIGGNPVPGAGGGAVVPGAGGQVITPGGGGSGFGGAPAGNGGGAPVGGNGAGGGSAGSGGGGDAGGGNYTVDPVGNANRAPGFVDLTPPMLEPLSEAGDPVTTTPPTPAGWVWHKIDGTFCRDGSQNGLYVHKGTANKLMIYLEGGGACSNDHFCAFNPASVDSVLAGDGQAVFGSAVGTGAGRQQPGVYTDGNHAGPPAGIFDTANADNPVKDWNQIYIPYCTGDVHFGTNPNGKVPNLAATQKFVGYTNMQKFIGHIVPTYKGKVDQVLLTGSSAGGFGAALNFSMVQDAFGDTPVLAIDDSGPPFQDKFMPVCQQKKWRETWGFANSLPPDCKECRNADGGGLLNMADFLLRKHPKAKIAMISAMQDEVIRLFYSPGLNECNLYDTADPFQIFLGLQPWYPAQQYSDALNDLVNKYKTAAPGKLITYFIGGAAPHPIYDHEHLFRPEFFTAPNSGTVTEAAWFKGVLEGNGQNVGP